MGFKRLGGSAGMANNVGDLLVFQDDANVYFVCLPPYSFTQTVTDNFRWGNSTKPLTALTRADPEVLNILRRPIKIVSTLSVPPPLLSV